MYDYKIDTLPEIDIAVFKSKNYKLNSGTDREDLFKDADFLFYLKTDRYKDYVDKI